MIALLPCCGKSIIIAHRNPTLNAEQSNMSTSKANQAPSVSAELGSRVVRTALALGAIAAPLAGLMVIAQALLAGNLASTTLLMCIYTMAFPLLWTFGRHRNYKLIGSIFIGLLLLMTFMVQIRSGPYTSQAPLQLLTLILSGLIFGKRGVYVTLVINLCLFAAAGTLLLNDIVPSGVALYFDPNSAAVWMRSAAIMTLFGGGSAWAVVYTIEKLQEETAKLRETLAREHDQLQNLARAEKDKQEAMQAVAEAQRIEVLGRLASGVAHDFNNSLTVIMTSTEMAQRDPDLSPRVTKLLASIKKASLQAADMTKSLLALGRKDPARLSMISADTVLNSMYEAITRLLPEDIVFTITETTPAKIMVDRVQLERAILNMVINAKDAVGTNGEIAIGCRQVKLMRELSGVTEGSYVQFSVKDNGHGISAEVLEHIFEPFYTTKSDGEGSGLGMALLHSFALESKGKVEIDSTVGIGTKIFLYLPEATGEMPTLAAQSPAPFITKVETEYTILVVEDNLDVLKSTSDTLTLAGFKVVEATNGDAALKIIKSSSTPFDLMCIDGVIPGASSAQVIQHLQKNFPKIKIVVCSGYIEEDLILRGIRMGDLAYVRKPYLIEELLDCINVQLSISKPGTLHQ